MSTYLIDSDDTDGALRNLDHLINVVCYFHYNGGAEKEWIGSLLWVARDLSEGIAAASAASEVQQACAAYEDAKREADRLETDEASGVQIDAFYAMLPVRCRSASDIQAKASLLLRIMEKDEMTVEEGEMKTFLRSVVGGAS